MNTIPCVGTIQKIAPVKLGDVNQFGYWFPYVPEFKPCECVRSSLRYAGIVGERLFRGLRYEGYFFFLNSSNYADIIQHGQIDCIIIEPDFKIAGSFWENPIQSESQYLSELHDLILLAKRCHIPCVGWFTRKSPLSEKCILFLHSLHAVFSPDRQFTDILCKRSINCYTLPSAVQPAIHNPFKECAAENEYEVETLFDGLADLLHFGSAIPLKELDSFDVKIIDSQNLIYSKDLDRLTGYQKNILGCVTQTDRLTLLKHSRNAISFEKTLANNVDQSWSALETMACRIPLSYLGKLSENDICKDLILEAGDERELRILLSSLREEPLFREQHVQHVWREIHRHHTFEKRLKEICKRVEVHYPEPDIPLVTTITIADDPNTIESIVRNLGRQNYHPSQHIIVRKGVADHGDQMDLSLGRKEDVVVTILNEPNIHNSASLLNRAVNSACGKYCIVMEHDDHFADDYISDIMLHLKSIDADFLIKPLLNQYHESDDEIYCNFSVRNRLVKLDATYLQQCSFKYKTLSLAGKTTALRSVGFDDSFQMDLKLRKIEESSTFFSLDQHNVVANISQSSPKESTLDPSESIVNFRLQSNIALDFFTKHEDIKAHNDASIVNRLCSSTEVILFFGLGVFNETIWQTCLNYIYPDLFTPLSKDFQIHMITGPQPDYVKPGIQILSQNFNVIFHELGSHKSNVDLYNYWIKGGTDCAEKIGASIVTNVFGSSFFAYVLSSIARKLNISSVVRVAGDEITSRVAVGKYLGKLYFENCSQFKVDMRREILGFSRSDRIIVMSPWEFNRVVGQCANPDRVKIIARGVDLQHFSPSTVGVKKPVRSFLYIGRNSKEKGYDIIEGAATVIHKAHPRIKFLFAGNFEVKKEKNRNYLGYIEPKKLPELYESIDAVILCSRTEGMPQVVFEAMAMGKPCILSKHLFASLFTDGVEALLTEITIHHLSDKILELHTDTDLANKLSINSRKYAERHFDKEKHKQLYKDVFLEVAGARKPFYNPQ